MAAFQFPDTGAASAASLATVAASVARRLSARACYAIGKVHFRKEGFDFSEEYALLDALAGALAGQARRAFSAGLRHGCRADEGALYAVRGRIRLDDQLRRFRVALP